MILATIVINAAVPKADPHGRNPRRGSPEAKFRAHVRKACKAVGLVKREGFLGMEVAFFGQHPKAKTIDLSNVLADALEGVAFTDRGQLVTASYKRLPCDTPKAVITLFTCDHEARKTHCEDTVSKTV